MAKAVKSPKVTNAAALEAKKESKIKELCSTLAAQGYSVRREKLKQGPGWRTVSGSCRIQDSKVIFVDRKLVLEEQLVFLQTCARSIGIDLSEQSDAA